MNLNKTDLYKQVAKKCNVTKNDVTKILKSTEEIVFDYLAHVEENELRKVFIMNGLCAESKIVHQKERVVPSSGGLTQEDRIMLTAKISKRYKDKINQSR
ncbi:HU family DNA-binding protein [Anaerostipes sp. Marseille-Q3525]|uniref:HU family DNA-binding protein n=1 Tax=Anaerostipes sp. Marseille-Q3525 TaxID=2758418 RepID=UPI001BADB999|nr:HU family DNA-binding protein [Anaerostipes sp. Marseille-Q3525]MBR9960904.1 HU family DNA-binding protein [Anaerostipes sp. Marseille-Q3525]